MKNHKNWPRTMKNQHRRKWWFFVTDKQTLHHNTYIISIILKWRWSLWSSGPNFAFDGFHSGKLCTHTTFHLQAIHHILHNMEGSIEERLPPFWRYLQNVEDVIKDLFLPYALQRERKWAFNDFCLEIIKSLPTRPKSSFCRFELI